MNAAPTCCGVPARLTDGLEIYPHRPDLHTKPVWKCARGCGAYVGCHPGTTNALGTPAGVQLRQARMRLHERMIDPLWKTADSSGGYTPDGPTGRRKIQRAARTRVYAFLAFRLGIPPSQSHTGMFDIGRCREAWRALQGVRYPEIQEWWKSAGKAWLHADPQPGGPSAET